MELASSGGTLFASMTAPTRSRSTGQQIGPCGIQCDPYGVGDQGLVDGVTGRDHAIEQRRPEGGEQGVRIARRRKLATVDRLSDDWNRPQRLVVEVSSRRLAESGGLQACGQDERSDLTSDPFVQHVGEAETSRRSPRARCPHRASEIGVEQNVTKFDSHTNAVQTLLDGKAQVMATSFSAVLDAREQGEDVKMFCPYVSMDDFVLAGANGVNNASQLFEPSTR
jgi:hypothetical protein